MTKISELEWCIEDAVQTTLLQFITKLRQNKLQQGLTLLRDQPGKGILYLRQVLSHDLYRALKTELRINWPQNLNTLLPGWLPEVFVSDETEQVYLACYLLQQSQPASSHSMIYMTLLSNFLFALQGKIRLLKPIEIARQLACSVQKVYDQRKLLRKDLKFMLQHAGI